VVACGVRRGRSHESSTHDLSTGMDAGCPSLVLPDLSLSGQPVAHLFHLYTADHPKALASTSASPLSGADGALL
jgi:hypothetical protein